MIDVPDGRLGRARVPNLPLVSEMTSPWGTRSSLPRIPTLPPLRPDLIPPLPSVSHSLVVQKSPVLRSREDD